MGEQDQDKRRELAQLCADVGPATMRVVRQDTFCLARVSAWLDHHASIRVHGSPSPADCKETLAAVSALLRAVVTAKVAALEQEEQERKTEGAGR